MVTRCICHDITFARLRAIATDERLDLPALKERTGCCAGCGTCEPYIRLMFRTGDTVFPVLERKAADELMRSPAAEFAFKPG